LPPGSSRTNIAWVALECRAAVSDHRMVPMRVRTALGLLVILAPLGLAACGDSPTEPGSALVATWDVRSVDGQTLPHSVTEDFGGGLICTMTVTSMDITFTRAGRYAVNFNGTVACPGLGSQTFTEPTAGTYRVSGTSLYMKQDPDAQGPHSEERSTFSISGRTLTITDDDGTVIVLERR
jgi:hypothetical protein